MMLTWTSQPWARISSTKAVTRPKRARGTSSETSKRTMSSSDIVLSPLCVAEAEYAVVQALEVGVEHLGAQVRVETVGHADVGMAQDALHGIHGSALLAQQAGEVVAQPVEGAVSHTGHLEASLLVLVEQPVGGARAADLLGTAATVAVVHGVREDVRESPGWMDGRTFPRRTRCAVLLLHAFALFFKQRHDLRCQVQPFDGVAFVHFHAGLHHRTAAVDVADAPADVHLATIEVEIVPAESEDFLTAESVHQGDGDDDAQLRAAHVLQQREQRVRIGWCDFLTHDAWQIDVLSWTVDNQLAFRGPRQDGFE